MHLKFIPITLFCFVFLFISELLLAEEWKYAGPDGGEIHSLVQDRRNPGLWLTVAGQEFSLYRSTDNGKTWQDSGLNNIHDLFIHPRTSQILVVRNTVRSNVTYGEIFISTNQGKSFQPIYKLRTRISKIVVDPVDSERLLMLISDINQLYISNDSGLNWKPVKKKPLKVGDKYPGLHGCFVEDDVAFQDLIIMPFDSNVLYGRVRFHLVCGDDDEGRYFLARSINGGVSWNFVIDGFYKFHTDVLFPNQAFIFGNNDFGSRLYLVTRSGLTELSNIRINLITEISRDSKQLLAYGDSGFLRSHDGGQNWTPTALNPLQQKISVLRYSALESGDILAGTSEAGVFRTVDRRSWSRSSSGIREIPIGKLEVGGLKGFVYALTAESLGSFFPGSFMFRKAEGHTYWKDLTKSLPAKSEILSLSVHPLDDKRLLAIRNDDEHNSFMTSFDGGVTWKRQLLEEAGNLESCIWDPSNKEVAYLLDERDPLIIWKTTNSGKNFEKFEVPQIVYTDGVRLFIDPRNPESLYLLHYGGISYSNDGGKTFHKINSPINSLMKRAVDMVPLPESSSFLVLTLHGELHKTKDAGKTWKMISNIGKWSDSFYSAFPLGKHFFAIRRLPSNDMSRLLESQDGGITWKDITADIDSTGVFDIAIQQNGILAGTNHGVRLLKR